MSARIPRVQRLISNSSRDNEVLYETNRITSIELKKNHRVLYFSDGTLESDTDSDEIDVTDRKNIEYQESFSLRSRLKNVVLRLGSSILTSVDYVGEELASMLGITSKPELKLIEFYKQNNSSVNPEEGANDWINGFNNNHQRSSTRVPITSDLRH